MEASKPLGSLLMGAPQDQAKRWTESEYRAPVLTDEQRVRLSGYDRMIKLLMEAAPWCLDCARVAPYMK